MNSEISTLPEARAIRRWIALAVGSLVLAGMLSLMLVIARAPGTSALVSDPLFFRRCLVVHVDLSLVVWAYAFATALLFLLPRAGESSLVSRAGVFVSTGGVGLLVLSAMAPGAKPVLSNYVPMIEHWSFGAGLIIFALGVLIGIVDRRLLPSEPAPSPLLFVPEAAIPGLRATGLLLIVAALTFAASWSSTPSGLAADVRYELANWGGGHVLSAAGSAAMASTWLILLAGDKRHQVMPRWFASLCFGLLVLPWLWAPMLAASGVQDTAAREGFTTLMRWGIFPPIAVLAIASLVAFFKTRTSGGAFSLRRVGFVASLGLTALGWVLGALIRDSTTLIPAHYHAAIGGVTVAFMAVTYPVLHAAGLHLTATERRRKLAIAQPAVFAIGQAIFAVGFGYSGAHGMGRKLYGAEQTSRELGAWIGLGVMGIGGLVAIVGGLMFIALTFRVLRLQRTSPAEAPLSSELGGSHG